MSKVSDILMLQADGDQVILVRARDCGHVELADAGVFRPQQKSKDVHILDDPSIRDALSTHVAQHGWRGREVMCLLGGSSAACHYHELPRLQEAELRQAVQLKLKQQLHFDVAEAMVAVRVLTGSTADQPEQVRVQSTAAHRERISSLLAVASRAGLEVVGISATPAALTALAEEHLGAEPGASAALYVDETASTLIVLRDGSPCVTAEVPMGLGSLTAALMRPIIDGERVIQLDEAQAKAIRNTMGIPTAGQSVEALGVNGQRLAPLIEPTLQKFAKHLTQWLTFAATSMGKQKIGLVRLIGPGAAIPNFGQGIGARIACEVRPEQWLREVRIAPEAGEPLSVDRFAAIVGAARHRGSLPDLLPSEIRFRHRLNRIRKSVAACGVVVAAAALGLAVLFDQIYTRLEPSVELQRRHLPEVQEVVGQNQRWERQEADIRRMEAQFNEVAAGSPMWSGLFKELAARLPAEVRAKELSVRRVEDGMRLTLNGEVLVRKEGSGFDPVVEKTLLQLQRSPFIKRVQLLGASRETEEGKEAAGVLSIEMDLICPGGSLRT